MYVYIYIHIYIYIMYTDDGDGSLCRSLDKIGRDFEHCALAQDALAPVLVFKCVAVCLLCCSVLQ